MQFRIPSGSPVVGQRISDLQLPEECLIISVRRGRKLHMAHGYTTLEKGDRVTLFSASECMLDVEDLLTGSSAD
jgi:Trk K+ transport system NAD-binding subunit